MISIRDLPVGEWIFGVEEFGPGAAVYNGPTLFPDGINPGTTKTGMVVMGPNGARANFPAVKEGAPGQPPQLTGKPPQTLPPGSNATFELVPTAPGGSGIASAYDVYVGIPAGEPAESTPNTLISPQPSDLDGSPAAGYAIGYSAANGHAMWKPLPFMALYNVPSSSIDATGTGAGQTRTLTYISVPPQPAPYIPIVLGADATIIGTANTQVDLVARVGGSPNTTTGIQIARGRGLAGAITGANPWTAQIIPNFTSLLVGANAFAPIAANTRQPIYLNCEQQAQTADQYSTSAASFTIGCVAVLS